MNDWFNFYLLLGSKDNFKTKEVVQVKAKSGEEAMQEFKDKGYKGWWLYITTWNVYNQLRFVYKFTTDSDLDNFILSNYIALDSPKYKELHTLVKLITSKSIDVSYFMHEIKELGVTLEQVHVNFGVFIRRVSSNIK